MDWIVGLALLFIVLLCCVAAYFLLALNKLRRLQQTQELERAKASQAFKEQHAASIRIIARAYSSGQVECAEACLRISNLLDILGVSGEEREPFIAVDTMWESIKHIPIKENWNVLGKKERKNHQLLIDEKTEQLKDFVAVSMRLLERFQLDNSL